MNTTLEGTFDLGSEERTYSLWSGQLLGECVAVDTETTLIKDPDTIPRICLASVSDGTNHYIVQPELLPEFLTLHLANDRHLVFHNVAFDFWVIDQYLTAANAMEARNWFWTAVDQHRIHDTMLLGALVSLARSDDDRMVSLADACLQRLGIAIEKDEYRLRFGELLRKPWSEVENGFFDYAIKDAAVTWHLFATLTHDANEICQEHDLSDQYGFLTEAIQVKAAIGLDRIHRNGMPVDLARAQDLREKLDSEIFNLVTKISSIAPDVWHSSPQNGTLDRNGKTVLPKVNQKGLRSYLSGIAEEHGLVVPMTPKGEIRLSVKTYWSQHRQVDPLIDAYCKYTELTKLRSFLDGLSLSRIHPRYRTLVRTGRTSCSGPNVQQLPSKSAIREVVSAGPENVLFSIDYGCLELRTLAAVCHQTYGFSRLRDVLIEGIDPHRYTAAMFAGISVKELSERPDCGDLRQHAKVFNFGIPGGFSPKSLTGYAKLEYGVELSQEEAECFIHKLTQEVYPEIGLYLSEDTQAIVAAKLRADPLAVAATWPEPYELGMLKKIVHGKPCRADGKPYLDTTIERMWLQLQSLCRNPELIPHIESRDTGADSPLRNILASSVSTVTGRTRGSVRFTQAKNTPFQGLAADGCKQALWELTKAGYRVIAFIHDEFIIEIPEADHYTHVAKDINEICCRSMEEFVPGIPVTCEYAVSRRWSKQAEATYDSSGRLIPWQCN